MTAPVSDAPPCARHGHFAGPRGKATLALAVATSAVVAVIYRRQVRTRGRVLQAALHDGLGPDYADTVARLPTAPSQSAPPSMWRTTRGRRRYVKETDIVCYGPHRWANLADVWRRHDLPRDGKAPVLVQIPGGAWALGQRRPQAYPLLGHLADRGWICVSLNYRVSPVHTWPAQIVDVKRALAWVKDNIAAYGGDPDFVAITGGSAGGHLAALAALTPNDPQFQPGFAEADTSVVAAVPLYGRYDWLSADGSARRGFIAYLEIFVVKQRFAEHREVYANASPICKVRRDAPPFFIVHGAKDPFVPVSEARDFAAKLRMVSQSPAVYAELPDAGHAFDLFDSTRTHQVVEAVGYFLSWVYATTRPVVR